MKIVIFLTFLVIMSCSESHIKNPNIDIIIEESTSYKYDLKKGIFTTFYVSKPKLEINFKLSEHENEIITKQFYDLQIQKIRKIDKEIGNINIKDECDIMPKFYTFLKIKSVESFQEIQIDESCDDFYLSNFTEAKRIKAFLKYVMAILQSKAEIQMAPKSDIIYL